jgi:hypothetical protein
MVHVADDGDQIVRQRVSSARTAAAPASSAR